MNELYLSIQQAQKDPSQMEVLIEKFRPLILKYARHLNKTERDDAIQDMIVAFILVIKKMELNKFPQEASEKYLLSYIQKQCIPTSWIYLNARPKSLQWISMI